MTPKTQSVCKHCQQSFDKHGNNGACIIGDTGFLRGTTFEPVAEPASTGEPPTECRFCKQPELYKPASLYTEYSEYPVIGERPVHESILNPRRFQICEAARPSGPSAPQVEPHVICGNCRKTLKWFPSEPHMNHENNDIHCYPDSEETVTLVYVTPVPQTSAEPRCPKCGVGKSLVLRDYEDGWRLVCGANCGLIIGPNAATGMEFDLTDVLPFFPASLKGCKPLRNKAMDYLREAIEECRTGKTITFQADHLITLLVTLGDESTAVGPQPVPRADGPEHPIIGPEDGSPCCEHCTKHPGSQWTLKVSQPVSGDAPKVKKL